jgi:peptide/nickel transport system substrate-binding protein
MFRGFRWQLLALLLATGIFVASLVVRLQPSALPSTPLPASATATATTSPAAEPTTAPVILPTLQPGTRQVAFREAVVGSISRLNPLFADLNPVDRDISALIFEGLVRTNQYGEPIPLLASDWVISSDGLEYVFTLREDVLWQDGVPFSALDVGYTMSILRDPLFPGSPELRAFWRTVETEVLGTHIVRFRLTQPLGTFLDELQIGILPEHALRGTSAQQLASHPFNLTPIGTGAYQLESLTNPASPLGGQVTLRRAPVYRSRQQAQTEYAIDRITMVLYPSFEESLAALNSGAVDALAASSADERTQLVQLSLMNPNIAIYSQIENTLGALIFNWMREDAPFLREQRVRVALQSGLDRNSIIERNLVDTAIAANSPLMPGSWAYQDNLPWAAYNPQAARDQLATASARLAAATPESETAEGTDDGSFFTMSILTPDTPALVQICNEIAAQWAQIGVRVTVDAVSIERYRSRLEAGDFVIAFVEYSLGSSADPDVYTFWHQGQIPPDGLNYGGADDGRISELLERARRDASGINRIEIYRQFQQEFAERVIAIPLYYPLFTYAVSSAYSGVQLGFMGGESDRFRTIGEWSRE